MVGREADCLAATVGSLRASAESARRAVLPTEFCNGMGSESDETVMDQSNKQMRKPGSQIELPGTYHHSSTDRGNDLRSRARIRLVGSKLAVKVSLIGVSATGLSPFLVVRAARRVPEKQSCLRRLGESRYVKRLSESLAHPPTVEA